jgi:hypothetical protein
MLRVGLGAREVLWKPVGTFGWEMPRGRAVSLCHAAYFRRRHGARSWQYSCVKSLAARGGRMVSTFERAAQVGAVPRDPILSLIKCSSEPFAR